MTTRLYIRRGGGASVDTEYTAAFTAPKGTPFFDEGTALVQLGMRFADGEASQGYLKVTDPEAELSDATFRLPPHALVTLTEDASGAELWMSRGRIAPIESGRGDVPAGNFVEWDVTVTDCNIDLRFLPFSENWERPEETDYERLVALQAYILNGASSTSPNYRETTDITIDDTHLAPNTNTATMPAKTYPAGTHPQDVILDCAGTAGKIHGVVIHHTGGSSHLCLLYIIETDYATYSSAVKISDQLADWDPDDLTAPVFEPFWDQGKGTVWDHDPVITALLSRWSGTNDNPSFVYVDNPGLITANEYWGDTFDDSESEDETQATARANSELSYRSPSTPTHRLSILMSPAQRHLIAAGMTIQIKSAVTGGGANLGTYLDRRIIDLRWEPNIDGRWWARLQLGRSVRRRRGTAQPGSTVPKPPDQGEPGTDPVGCTELASYSWTYDTNTDSTGSGVFSWADNWNDGTGGLYAGDFTGGYGYNGLSNDFLFATSKHAINPDEQVYLQVTANNRGASDLSTRQYKVNWYDAAGGSGSIISTVVILTVAAVDAPNTYSGTVTAPAGAGGFSVEMPRQIGHDNVTLSVLDCSGATPGTDPTPSSDGPTTVGGTGDGAYSDSDKYVPVGSVLEHLYITEGGPYHDADQVAIDDAGGFFTGTDVEAALQELGDAVGGSTGLHRTDPEYAVPEWVDPTGSGQITMAPETRISVETGTGYSAFPAMVLARGVLHLFYRKGTDHIDTTDGTLEYRTSDDLGQTWTAATTIHNPSGDVRDPYALYHSSGRLVVAFTVSPVSAGTGRTLWSMYSDNLGLTWSTPAQITDHGWDSLPVVGHMAELTDGTIVMGSYGKFAGDTQYSSAALFSNDRGATFGSPVTIADGEAAGRMYGEPVMRLLSSGRLVCLLRSDTTDHTYRSISTDGGATWSAVADVLTATGRPDFVEFYPGALVAFLRNDATDFESRYTTSWDEGATWTALAETDTGETDNQEYAAPVVLAPGYVFTVYGLEASSTDADMYGRYFYDGSGMDVLGHFRTSRLSVAGVEIDPAGAADGEVLTYDSGTGKIVLEAPSAASVNDVFTVDPGSVSYAGATPTVTVTSVFGIDGSGNPYYNSANVTSGEEAALMRDATTGEYFLRPYNF